MIRRGEVRIVDFKPTRGTEATNRRPAVVVSNDGANETASVLGRGVVTVVPLTSNTDRVYPFQVLVPAAESGLHSNSKAQAEQLRSVDVSRLGKAVSQLPLSTVEAIDQALRIHLDL